jgi:DNA polymerase III delta subunit
MTAKLEELIDPCKNCSVDPVKETNYCSTHCKKIIIYQARLSERKAFLKWLEEHKTKIAGVTVYQIDPNELSELKKQVEVK